MTGQPPKDHSKIVLGYLDRWGGLPSLTLAKKIYAEHPERFNDVEFIRHIIRRYRGANGEQNRHLMRNTRFYDQRTLPESYAPDYEPYNIPLSWDRILVMSDIHLPFQDNIAIDQAIRWGKEHNVSCILLNGDTVDCYQLSKFIKDSRYPTIRQELDAVAEFLAYIRQEFPGVKIIWKNGNHEERLEAHMKIKNPELLDVVEWHFNELPQLREYFRDMVYVTDRRVIYAGKLPIVHGHEFFNRNQNVVNPARTLFLKTYHSGMIGHLHKASEHTGKRITDEVMTCWSTGCLCGLHPEYARLNEWVHSFGFIKVAPDGTYKVSNIRIIDGKIY